MARRNTDISRAERVNLPNIYDAKIQSVRLEFSVFVAFFAERHTPRMCGEHDVARAKNGAARRLGVVAESRAYAARSAVES